MILDLVYIKVRKAFPFKVMYNSVSRWAIEMVPRWT